jgi:hypothetical protein
VSKLDRGVSAEGCRFLEAYLIETSQASDLRRRRSGPAVISMRAKRVSGGP